MIVLKRFFFLISFVFLLSVSVFASSDDERGDVEVVHSVYVVASDTDVSAGSGSFGISSSQLLTVLASLAQNQSQAVPSDLDLVNVSILKSVAPVTPSDATGLKAVLLEFIGDYDPVIVEYEYRNQNSQYSSYLREVQPDYPWLVSCGLLIVVIYCIFRLGGALFCKR